MPTLERNEHFSIQFFHHMTENGRKIDGVNLSQMDIKVFIPAPTFCLQAEENLFHNWKN